MKAKLKTDVIDKYLPKTVEIYHEVEGRRRVAKKRETYRLFGKVGDEVEIVGDHLDIMIIQNKEGRRTHVATEDLDIQQQ